MERFGARKTKLATGKCMKNMVGTTGLEPATSTVSIARTGFTTTYNNRGECQSSRKSYILWVEQLQLSFGPVLAGGTGGAIGATTAGAVFTGCKK